MPASRLTIGLHAGSMVLALAAALACPRPGQAALLVPLGVARVQQLVALLASLVSRFSEIAGQVDEISHGSDRAVDAIRQIDTSLATLDQGMHQNAALAEQTSAASVQLLSSAEHLSSQVSRFQHSTHAVSGPMVTSRAA